jgi:hypothetical protein
MLPNLCTFYSTPVQSDAAVQQQLATATELKFENPAGEKEGEWRNKCAFGSVVKMTL